MASKITFNQVKNVDNDKWTIGFTVAFDSNQTQQFAIPQLILAASACVAILDLNSVSASVPLPDIENIELNFYFSSGAATVQPLVLYMPETGEVVTVSPLNPTLPGAMEEFVSMCIPLIKCRQIYFISMPDSTAHIQPNGVVGIVSTFKREPFRYGI